jgi:azurin
VKSANALLAAACALALVACGNNDTAATDASPATTTAPAPAPASPPPVDSAAATADSATAGTATDMPPSGVPTTPAADASGKPAAVVENCATTIEGSDAMQYSVGSIVVPASCSEFTINLKHVGKLPVTAMGHNVVVSSQSDMQGVNADGIAAGADAHYVKAGDARVLAASEMVGGGQSTSLTLPVSKLQAGGPYVFFCSFPGHAALMKGTISVGS